MREKIPLAVASSPVGAQGDLPGPGAVSRFPPILFNSFTDGEKPPDGRWR